MDSSRWYNLQSDRLHSAFEKQKNRCKKYTHILRGWLWVRLAGVHFHVLETKNQKRLSLWWDLMQIKYHMYRKRCEHGQNRSIKENRRAPWIGKRRNLKAGCYHHCKHGIPCGTAHCIAYFGRKKNYLLDQCIGILARYGQRGSRGQRPDSMTIRSWASYGVTEIHIITRVLWNSSWLEDVLQSRWYTNGVIKYGRKAEWPLDWCLNTSWTITQDRDSQPC